MAEEERFITRIDVQTQEQKLHSYARATQKVGRETKQAGNEAEQTTQKQGRLSGAFSGVLGSLKGLLAPAAGIAAATKAWSEYNRVVEVANQALKENARLTREAAQAALDLQSLNMVPDPEARAFAEETAVVAGREPTEGITAFGQLKSKFPDKGDEELREMFRVIAAKGQQTTAPLSTLVDTFSLLTKETGGDPVRAANILEQSITEAGEIDLTRVTPQIQKLVGVAKQVGGLTTAQGAALGVTATQLQLPREIATTGLRNVILSIAGRGTPEGRKILEREGVKRENIFEALQQISDAFSAGRITGPELEALGGRETIAVFSRLADPQILQRELERIQRIQRAADRPELMLEEKAENLFGAGSFQQLNLRAKQEEAEAKRIRGRSRRALRLEVARSTINRVLTHAVSEGQITPDEKEAALQTFNRQVAQGRSLERALQITEMSSTSSGFWTAPFNLTRSGGWAAGLPTDVDLEEPVQEAIEAQGGEFQINIIGQQYNRQDPAEALEGSREVQR